MASHGKEDPKSPENPEGPFQVIAKDTDKLFIQAQKNAYDGVNFQTNLTDSPPLDGKLFDNEATAFDVIHIKGKAPKFMVFTSLFLSHPDSSRARQAFTARDVHEIGNLLADRGVTSTIDTADERGNIILHILKDNTELRVLFPTSENKKQPRTVALRLLKIVNGPKGRSALSETSDIPQFDSANNFSRLMQTYALLYTHVVNAIYDFRNISAPKLNLVLAPEPDQDTPTLGNEDATTLEDFFKEESDVESGTKRKLTFEDIVGQDEAVRHAKRVVNMINTGHKIPGFARTNGMMFTGEPGVGKTLMAQIMADQCNAVFIEIKVQEIADMWYGNSEKLLQAKFDSAYEATQQGKKAIIFIDEMDALFGRRDQTHEATQRTTSVFNTNLGNARTNPNVYIIATTNRPESIDPAVRRAGRIDFIIHFETFDTPEKRKAIYGLYVNQAQSEVDYAIFDEELDWDYIAEVSGEISLGMDGDPITSGTDVLSTLKRAFANQEDENMANGGWRPINTTDLAKAIEEERNSRREDLRDKKKRRQFGFGTQNSPKS